MHQEKTVPPVKAYIALALAQSFVGLNLVIGKLLLLKLPVSVILMLRFGVSTISSGILFLYLKNSQRQYVKTQTINKQEWLLIILQALCAGVLFNAFILSGMNYTDVTSAGIISATLPAMIAILSVFFLKERMSKNQILSVALAVFSLIILQLSQSRAQTGFSKLHVLGDFLVIMSLLPEAMFTILAKWKPTKVNLWMRIFFMCLVNFICLLPIGFSNFMQLLPVIDAETVGLIISSGFCGGLFFLGFWCYGLKYCSSADSAVFTSFMPISTSFFAFLILHKHLGVMEIISILFVLFSIMVGARKTPLRLFKIKALQAKFN